MKEAIKSIVITRMPLRVPKEEAFACAMKDRILINAICEYRKQLESENKEVYARKDNVIVCEDGYYFAFYEDELMEAESNPEPFMGEDGRMKVFLHGSLKSGVEDLAKLVATTFIPNPHNFPDVLFKDKNPCNCSADNLYWSIKKDEE